MNRLTPAWRFFPSKRALDYLRGTLLKPAQVDLADTVELVHGQWNSEGGNSAVLLHYFKSRKTSGLIKGLAEEIHTIQQVRARCGEAQRATARGALVHGQTGSVLPLHVNLLTPRTEGGARAPARLDWVRCGWKHSSNCGTRHHPPGRVLQYEEAKGWESYQGRRTIV